MSAAKHLLVDGLGTVRFQKRQNARNIRITISHSGEIRVSLPTWVPYRAAVAFTKSKTDWINHQRKGKSKHAFSNSERVGKSHRIEFISSSAARVTTRLTETEIFVFYPKSRQINDIEVQAAAAKAATKALKKQAEKLLLPRLHSHATRHGFEYKSVSIKTLKTRWGSCSSDKVITLNCYLMQLPWDLIDYVMLHELVHTQVMAHGPKFWKQLDKYVTNLPAKRKAMKNYHPALSPQD